MNREAVEVPGWLNVSRETLAQLFDFCDLVEKWNPVINLVSRAGIADLWPRHVIDSAQLFFKSPEGGAAWCDLGSGGGFPGIVLAILAKELRPDVTFTLVESDSRKAVFLAESARVLSLPVVVLSHRIENLAPQNADVLTARALAPLSQLCGFAHRHLKPTGIAIFPKGAAATREIDDARKTWSFKCESSQSTTDADAAVLTIRDIHRA